MSRRQLLINHYKEWANTTNNKAHKAYAEAMLQSVYEDDYVRAFQEIGARSNKLHNPVTKEVYNTIEQAAESFGVSIPTMSINYLRYGLKKGGLYE